MTTAASQLRKLTTTTIMCDHHLLWNDVKSAFYFWKMLKAHMTTAAPQLRKLTTTTIMCVHHLLWNDVKSAFYYWKILKSHMTTVALQLRKFNNYNYHVKLSFAIEMIKSQTIFLERLIFIEDFLSWTIL